MQSSTVARATGVAMCLLATLGACLGTDTEDRQARQTAATYLGVPAGGLESFGVVQRGLARYYTFRPADAPVGASYVWVEMPRDKVVSGPLRHPWRGPGALAQAPVPLTREYVLALSRAYFTEALGVKPAELGAFRVHLAGPDPLDAEVWAVRLHNGLPTEAGVSVEISSELGAVVWFYDTSYAVDGPADAAVTAQQARATALAVEFKPDPDMNDVVRAVGPLATAEPELAYGFPDTNDGAAAAQRLIWTVTVCRAADLPRLATQPRPERQEVKIDARSGKVLSCRHRYAEPPPEKAVAQPDLDFDRLAQSAAQGRPWGSMLGVDPVKQFIQRTLAPEWQPAADAKWRRDPEERAKVYLGWEHAGVKLLAAVTTREDDYGTLSMRLVGPVPSSCPGWPQVTPQGDSRLWLQEVAKHAVAAKIMADLLPEAATRRFHLSATRWLLAGQSVASYTLETRERELGLFGVVEENQAIVRLNVNELAPLDRLRALDAERGAQR